MFKYVGKQFVAHTYFLSPEMLSPHGSHLSCYGAAPRQLCCNVPAILAQVVLLVLLVLAPLMPMACAQSYCTEAARAAALASHSAASLAAAAGFREAARLLRSSEALARAATAALLALPRSEAPTSGSGNSAAGGDATEKKKKRRSNKKLREKQVAMEGVIDGSERPPPAEGVPEAAPAAVSASTLSRGAADFVPGMAARVVAPRISRECSPHGASASLTASPNSGHAFASTDTGIFAVGQAVALVGLVSRADLVGKFGVVKFFDVATSRYAVCIDATGETVRALEKKFEGEHLWTWFCPGQY